VSRLAAIEDLAGLNMLCSDKTGTLTKNKMVIQNETPVYVPGLSQMDLLKVESEREREREREGEEEREEEREEKKDRVRRGRGKNSFFSSVSSFSSNISVLFCSKRLWRLVGICRQRTRSTLSSFAVLSGSPIWLKLSLRETSRTMNRRKNGLTVREGEREKKIERTGGGMTTQRDRGGSSFFLYDTYLLFLLFVDQISQRLQDAMEDYESLQFVPFDPRVKRSESTIRIKSKR
jgi:magnesium-transporting ATPase (P-type)